MKRGQPYFLKYEPNKKRKYFILQPIGIYTELNNHKNY